MDHIIYTTLNAFRESWRDVDTSVWEILAGRITILTDRRMIHSICLDCPTTKTEERNDASQDTKPSNHNSDMIEVPDSEIKQQTQDITNLQDVCSIEEGVSERPSDISFEKPPLEDREVDAGTSDIPSSESSTSSYPIPNNPVLSAEQNAKIKAPEIDIQLLIEELLIEPSEEDCVKVVNVEESDQSPAIELAHLEF